MLRLEGCVFAGTDHPDRRWLSTYYGLGRVNVLKTVKTPLCGRRFLSD